MNDDTNLGSRDRARDLLKVAAQATYEALEEIERLSENELRLEYRRSSIYIGMAIHNIELARIEMRKRRRQEAPKAEPPSA